MKPGTDVDKVAGETQKNRKGGFVLKVEQQKSSGRSRAISDLDAKSPSIRSADSCDKQSTRSGGVNTNDMLSQK